MKALTIWQPWASLIMVGAKPYEFRHWDYRRREPRLEGQRIVIHAGARPVSLAEVADLLRRLERASGGLELDHGTALKVDLARQLLVRVYAAHSAAPILPLRCGLGTATLCTPRRPSDLFRGRIADSTRFEHQNWAWPLTDIQPFDAPVPARGLQGFWDWQLGQEAA